MEAILPAWRCASGTACIFSTAAPASECWDNPSGTSSTAVRFPPTFSSPISTGITFRGFRFSVPLYDNRENRFQFHCSSRTRSLKRVLEEQMAAPYFPVGLTEMQAHQNFYDLDEGRIQLGDVTLQTLWLNHPQGCMGFRLETKEGVMVYATDNEPGDALFDKNLRKLAAGADVLIYDAQYLPEEYARKHGWGHSHWREAINVVTESGAKELVLFHHDPDHDDACIDKVVKEARDYYPRLRAAAEGMQIEVSAKAPA